MSLSIADTHRVEPSIRDEFARLGAGLPNKGILLLLLVAWATVFHFFGNSTLGYQPTPSLFGWLNSMYEAVEDDAFGAVVPFLVAGLLWWQREDILRVVKRPAGSGMVLVLLAAALHAAGFVIQQPRLSVVAFFLGLGGWVALIWGWAAFRVMSVPGLLFFFCIPLSQAAEPVTFPLRMIVSKVSVGFCNGILGIDVLRDGSLIFNAARTFQYDVAPACSGIRSLTALGCLGFVFAIISFNSWWRRLALLGSVFPLAVAGNILRIIAVIVVAELWGQDAGAKVETNLGFLTFLVAFAGMFLVERVLREPSLPSVKADPPIPRPTEVVPPGQ